MEQPLELSGLFRRVRAQVLETTDGAERPHEYASLVREHYLSGAPVVAWPHRGVASLRRGHGGAARPGHSPISSNWKLHDHKTTDAA